MCTLYVQHNAFSCVHVHVTICCSALHCATACCQCIFLKVYQAALERGEDLGLMTSDVLLHDVLSDLYCISKGVKAYQPVVLPQCWLLKANVADQIIDNYTECGTML